MINSLLTGFINFMISSVAFFTGPINDVITTYLPSLSSAISAVNDLILWLIKFIVYVGSWLNFDSWFWTFLVADLTLILFLPLSVHAIKLALRWYRMLMP